MSKQTPAQRNWYLANRELTIARAARWIKNNKARRKAISRESAIRRANKIKAIVFSQYGKGYKPKCCWRGCNITDLDMLSLDHIKNDGAQHRKEGKHRGGMGFYWQLFRNKFPDGFQVLCWNHQWKKETIRRRKARLL
jgi:hypothetical protein